MRRLIYTVYLFCSAIAPYSTSRASHLSRFSLSLPPSPIHRSDMGKLDTYDNTLRTKRSGRIRKLLSKVGSVLGKIFSSAQHLLMIVMMLPAM